jgi:hypothetical protein
MKYLILALLVPLLGMTGCRKFLTTHPDDFVAPQANYSTRSQLLEALAGVYDVLGMERKYLYANDFYTYSYACSDLSFYDRSSQTTGPEVYNFDYTDPIINETWEALYTGIERANNLIAYIDVASGVDATERDAILGEAEFLRGYYYFLLVSSFGDVPLRTEPTTETGANTVEVPRTPAKEVYAQILKDMTDAEQKCYSAIHFTDASRISKTAVEGVLARVCLTMAGYPLHDTEKYKDALNWAQKVRQSGIHHLIPDYKQIFIDELQEKYDAVNKGVLWEAQFFGNATGINEEEGRLGNTNGITYTAANFADTGYSYGFINATKKLYNLYESGDLRRDWCIAPYGYAGTDRVEKGNLIYDRNMGKWRRSYETLLPKNKNFNGTNFPILRYADVLLMLAEAENEVNGPTQIAYDAINQVRRRGYGLPVDIPSPEADLTSGLSKEEFQQAIEDERARELCFECLRRPDLIRWGIFTQTMHDASVQMHQDLDNNNSWKYASLGATNAASSERYLLWPIPSSETSVNKAATQNPGY